MPPSTIIVCPTIYDAIGDARNSAAPAMSLGVPSRANGILSNIAPKRFGSSVVTFVNLESTNPGAIPLTRTPPAAQAAPSVRTKPSSALFEAEYAGFPRVAENAPVELITIIEPPTASSRE
jgi:hypothetical protein